MEVDRVKAFKLGPESGPGSWPVGATSERLVSETVFGQPCPRYSWSVFASQEWPGLRWSETLVVLGHLFSSIVSVGVEGERCIQGGANEGEGKDEKVNWDVGDIGDIGDDKVESNAVEEVGVNGDNGDKGDDVDDVDDESAKDDSEDRDGQEALCLSLSLILSLSLMLSLLSFCKISLVARRVLAIRFCCDPD